MVSYILLFVLLLFFSGFFISFMVNTPKFIIMCTLGTIRAFRYKMYCLSNSLIRKVRYGSRETHTHTFYIHILCHWSSKA